MVKLDLVYKHPFSFCFIEVSNPSPPLIRIPRFFGVKEYTDNLLYLVGVYSAFGSMFLVFCLSITIYNFFLSFIC